MKPNTPLSPKQRKILRLLLAERKILKRFDGVRDIRQLGKAEKGIFDFHHVEHLELMLKALRAGLHIHPRIRGKLRKIFWDFIRTRIALGDWDTLRKARGLEVGVKRLYSIKDIEFLNAVEKALGEDDEGGTCFTINTDDLASLKTFEDILQKVWQTQIFDPANPPVEPFEPGNPLEDKKPKTWTDVHQELLDEGTITMSRQAFLRKIKRLDPTKLIYFFLISHPAFRIPPSP